MSEILRRYTICCNAPNLFQQDGAPAHRSRHTVAYLRSNVPEFIEPENWSPNSPDLNPVDYAVWGGIAADGASSQNFRH